MSICITATGLYTPPHSISNDELVSTFNQYVDNYNQQHADAIAAGERIALQHSSPEFIEKVSGIKSRYVVDKAGILNPDIMAPILPSRKLGEQLSIMAEMGVAALTQALSSARLTGQDLDGVIVACSNFQRAYPAVAIEIQDAIGMSAGFAYDMNVACSAATFGISQAVGSIRSGLGKRVAVVNVEITSAHLNFRNRDSHFIFGDVATATIIEHIEHIDDVSTAQSATENNQQRYEIIDCQLFTQFSTNIKNEQGFLDRSQYLAEQVAPYPDVNEPVSDKLFLQNGRKVFREVCPKVAELIRKQLNENQIDDTQVKRLWLHQANASMIDLILRSVLGKQADKAITPMVIDEFANTSSASPVIVFHRDHHHKDNRAKSQSAIAIGDYGVMCSFGAGYSIGSVLLRRV